jgi:hypothetical protein
VGKAVTLLDGDGTIGTAGVGAGENDGWHAD